MKKLTKREQERLLKDLSGDEKEEQADVHYFEILDSEMEEATILSIINQAQY